MSYLKVLAKRTWIDSTRALRDYLALESLVVIAGAVVGYFRGDPSTQIITSGVYALTTASIVVICVGVYSLARGPGRIYRAQQNKIISLEAQLKPALKIEQSENDDRYYHESTWFHELSDIFDHSRGYKGISYWRLCRIAIKNSSTVSIESVEVKLTRIDPIPKELQGKLPLNLHFMHDNVKPYKQSKDLNPNSQEFIDVIGWSWGREYQEARFHVYHSVHDIDAEFPVGDYKITIEAFGKNVPSDSKVYYVGMRNRDGTANKIWMSEKPL